MSHGLESGFPQLPLWTQCLTQLQSSASTNCIEALNHSRSILFYTAIASLRLFFLFLIVLDIETVV